MSQLAAEREHLEKAAGHIAEGERRIAAQTGLVEQLRASGHDTTAAERLLGTLHTTLSVWHQHRDLIVQEIARLEQTGPA